MVTISELRMKEIINLANGKRIGFIEDFDINLEKNRVEAIIVPKEGKFLKIFNRDDNYYISWKNIVKIGHDVILVDIKDYTNYNEDYEEEEFNIKAKMLNDIKSNYKEIMDKENNE